MRLSALAILAALACAAPASAGGVLIANGLGPPNAENRIDAADDYADDAIYVRNVGCGVPDPGADGCAAPGQSTFVSMVNGGAVGRFVKVFESSIFAMSGGAIASNLIASGESFVAMNGGSVGGFLSGSGASDVWLTDGAVAEGLVASGSARFLVTGGTVQRDVIATDTSITEIRGGVFESRLIAKDEAFVSIEGSDFTLGGVPLGGGPIGPLGGMLAGTLASGEPIDLQVSRDPTATIEIVPEPGAAAASLAAFGSAALWSAARRRYLRARCCGSSRSHRSRS